MRSPRSLLALVFVAFAAFGASSAALGIAWPSIASTLNREVADLSWLLLVYNAGFGVAALLFGSVAVRMGGIGTAIAASALLATVGLTGYAISPTWVALLMAATVLGIANGLLDAGSNTYLALHHGTREMGFLHGTFGVGTVIGPLVMTAIIAWTWRLGYGVLAALQGLLTIAFVATRHSWAPMAIGKRQSLSPDDLRRLVPWLVAFFLAVGVEVGTGEWSFTLLTEGRDMADIPAGIVVTGYWASFTVGRFVLSAIGDRVGRRSLLVAGTIGIIVGLLGLWWSTSPWMSAIGLLLVGLSLAPLFPLLVLQSARVLGEGNSATMVGYSLGASMLGATALPVGLGPVVGRWGLEMVPPLLLAAGSALCLLVIVHTRSEARSAPSPL